MSRPNTQALSASVAGQVVDTFVVLAKRNTYLRPLLDGLTQQYRRALVFGLLATTGRAAPAQASALFSAVQRSLPMSVSDFELLKYYLLLATEHHRLALEARLKIAAALRAAGTRARARAFPPTTQRDRSAVPRNRGHWP